MAETSEFVGQSQYGQPMSNRRMFKDLLQTRLQSSAPSGETFYLLGQALVCIKLSEFIIDSSSLLI